jgi:hypothetical protein
MQNSFFIQDNRLYAIIHGDVINRGGCFFIAMGFKHIAMWISIYFMLKGFDATLMFCLL